MRRTEIGKWLLTVIVAGWAATCCFTAAAQEEDVCGWGLHKRVFAVPAPKNIKINGKLDGWDLSAAVDTFVTLSAKETVSGRLAIMYDADALYLGADVRDPSPMMNRHSPEGDGSLAWDADSLQFRFCADAKAGYPLNETTWGANDKADSEVNRQIKHLLLWYYTDRKEPNLQCQESMKYLSVQGTGKYAVVPPGKFEAVYAMREDGRGYTMTYRIPWPTMGVRTPPKGGDVVAATYQFNFGRPDGLKTCGFSGWAYDLMAFPGFCYQNSGCWGKLVFSKTGNLPRELVEEGLPPAKPLPFEFAYNLPEEGEVSVVLMNESNEVVRTLAASVPRQAGRVVEKWDGLDCLGRPLPAGTYAWKGLYHQPLKFKYLFSVHNSGQPAYQTPDNLGGWGGNHGAPIAVCRDGDDMILAWNSAEGVHGIVRTDGEGKKKWGSAATADYMATDGKRLFAVPGEGFDLEPGVKLYDGKDFRPLFFGNGSSVLPPPAGGSTETNRVSGLAYHGGVVYASYNARNLIALYDAERGGITKTWEIPAPGALAFCSDATLLAVSGIGKRRSVIGLRLSADAQQITGRRTLITDHLDAPSGLAVDASGLIYVSNQGRLQNVSVFAPDGKYQRSIGKARGRPALGRFDPAGMYCPVGLALDAKRRLWVMECSDSPKRVSVWDATSGDLVKEFFGAAHYSANVWMDPERPDEVYCDGALWKVDLDKNTWRPWSTVWRQMDPNAPPGLPTHGLCPQFITAKNGKQYCMVPGGGELFIRESDQLRPLVWMYFVSGFPSAGRDPFPALMRDHPQKYKDGTYVWVDANGDGLVQESEIQGPIGPSWMRGFRGVDRDLNLWHAGAGCATALKEHKDGLYVYRPIRIEANGTPVYDFNKPERAMGTVYYANELWVDPDDGSVCSTSSEKQKGLSLAGWAKDGSLLWGYRGGVPWHDALSLPPQRSGKIWGLTTLLGRAGDFVGFNTYFGVFHLYTTDGIPVGTVYKDYRDLGGQPCDIIACENGNGQIVKPKGMNRYFALAGDQDGRVSEILGLDTVKRLPGGKYNLPQEDVQKAKAAMDQYQARLAKSQKLRIVRGGRKALDVAQAVKKVNSISQGFEARAAYDAENLYVRFDVTSESELVNSVTERRLVFKGGNCLDIQIAADRSADPKRKTPAPGDVRILVTRQAGPATKVNQAKPYAVIFRPKVAGFKGQPIVLNSPTGKESFDSIEVCDKIALDYKKTPDAPVFTAVVTVPLELLGWRPQPDSKVRMDLGYIYGNSQGSKAMRRSYWTNNGFSANVLDDVPNESRLEPNLWGEGEVE